MNFETWFNQQELYGLKSERFYELLNQLAHSPSLSESAVAWLRAAYEEAYTTGYADAMNWKVQNHLEHLPAREKNT